MNSGTSLLLGLIFLGLGGLLWVAVRIALRQEVIKPTGEKPDFERISTPNSTEHTEGVLNCRAWRKNYFIESGRD